jgi:hypothetical protein
MKSYKLILFILVILTKTGNVLSDTNIFDVNNIEIEKRGKINNDAIANKAIKKGFNQLVNKILLKKDEKTLANLKFSEIKELVKYYKISNKLNKGIDGETINFDISFDKEKMHDLFFKRNILYSEITKKDLFILPILKKDNKIFIYNQNFFYDKWNEFYETNLIEFILPLENIEIIQNVNLNSLNLLNLKLSDLFVEYSGKNLALVLIEDNNLKEEIIYFKAEISGKNIVRNIKVNRSNLNKQQFYERIIINAKKEIVNLIKSENLIDVRAPSFLNAQLKINKKNNLFELNSRIKKIDLIEKIYVKEFNADYVYLKIKYLGKLDKIINQLKDQKVFLKFLSNEWDININ